MSPLPDRGASWNGNLLLVAVAGAPLFFLRNVADPITHPKLALLLVIVGAASALRAMDRLKGERN